MQIKKLPPIDDFAINECEFGGDKCWWIHSRMEGTKWRTDNLIFRSSIWRKSDGELVSAGFKKFFNWAQEPDIHPPPDALSTNIDVVEKLDGSCLIVSQHNGELIVRTRRASATTMLNGAEIAVFQKKYPNAFDVHRHRKENNSTIFEWLTPSNQIVVRYEEPEIKLIGAVSHDDYSLMSQRYLDEYAKILGVQRPKYFKYKTIEEMLQNITDLRGEEGVCVYYGNGQHIRKIKSDWYLSVHNFRNAMNLKNIVDLFLIQGKPDYNTFCKEVENQFTWEGLQMARPLISSICDAMKEVERIILGMRAFLVKLGVATRKEKADKIIAAYGNTSRADIVFNILDNKPLGNLQYKKLLFQVMAK